MRRIRQRSNDILESLAIRATRWIGSTGSLFVHTVLFIVAFVLYFFGIGINSILLVVTTLVSLEAIYLSIFIQMSVNRQAQELKDVALDVEEIQEDVEGIEKDVDEIQKDVEGIEKDVDEIQEDVEEIQEEDESVESQDNKTLVRIESTLEKLISEINELKKHHDHLDQHNKEKK